MALIEIDGLPINSMEISNAYVSHNQRVNVFHPFWNFVASPIVAELIQVIYTTYWSSENGHIGDQEVIKTRGESSGND